MDLAAESSWIVFGVLIVGSAAYAVWRLKGMQPSARETFSAYQTRMYGHQFLLQPGEALAFYTNIVRFDGPQMPEQHTTFAEGATHAAKDLALTAGAALIGVSVDSREGRVALGITSFGRVLTTHERGSIDHFVPRDWTQGAVLTDVESLGARAEGRPSLHDGGASGDWHFAMLVDRATTQRFGFWVPGAFAMQTLLQFRATPQQTLHELMARSAA